MSDFEIIWDQKRPVEEPLESKKPRRKKGEEPKKKEYKLDLFGKVIPAILYLKNK